MERSLRKPCQLFFSLRHPSVRAAFFVDVHRPAELLFGFVSIAFSAEHFRVNGIIPSQVEHHLVAPVCFDGLFDPMLGFGKVPVVDDLSLELSVRQPQS